jgi:hypothetical protein
MVRAILVKVEHAAVAKGLAGRWDHHLEAETTAVEHQFHGADETEGLIDRRRNGLHDAIGAALDRAATVHIGIEDEPTAAGVGDAADNLQAVVPPRRAPGDREHPVGSDHGLPFSLPCQYPCIIIIRKNSTQGNGPHLSFPSSGFVQVFT